LAGVMPEYFDVTFLRILFLVITPKKPETESEREVGS